MEYLSHDKAIELGWYDTNILENSFISAQGKLEECQGKYPNAKFIVVEVMNGQYYSVMGNDIYMIYKNIELYENKNKRLMRTIEENKRQIIVNTGFIINLKGKLT